VRKRLGLRLHDVHRKSLRIARKLGRKEFAIPPSRLHEFELKGTIPSIYRIYTLARVYGYSVSKVLSWYGIPKA